MKQNLPTLVLALYNRLEPATRLLNSLAGAVYPQGEINLVISIDNDDNNNKDVLEVAKSFQWKYGSKEVVYHPVPLGLRDHFNWCGDQTEKYGAVIFLEDDLYVSPWFYDYTLQALEFYKNDDRVAGISLFSYNRIEKKMNPWPFIALDDGYDNFFLQHASWGQVWTHDIWKQYKQWYVKYGNAEYINSLEQVPGMIRRWRASSWKKNYISYMILHGKYYVFPRISLATNFDDIGTHRKGNTVHYQSPLLVQRKEFHFSHFSESLSVYDPFFEILPESLKKLNPELEQYDFQVNLYGDKEPDYLTSKYVLSKTPGKSITKSFALSLKPHELNAVYEVPGNKIFLCETKDLISRNPTDASADDFTYFYRAMFKIGELKELLFYKIRSRWRKLWGR